MGISERILLSLSRSPNGKDFVQRGGGETVEDALNLLTEVYPDFRSLVSGKRVVDFGCGEGYQSIALAAKYGCSVVGVDSNQRTLRNAIENAKDHNIFPPQLSFVGSITPDMVNSFDIVISQNSFEHFTDPEKVLSEMNAILKNSGRILITFGPPWLAPYGSHMHFFCRVPWMNVLFSEAAVMNVRSNFRTDGAVRYEDVESGLNKMTIGKLEWIVSSCGLRVVYKTYQCVKGINWLSHLPRLREFFINHVTIVLAKKTHDPYEAPGGQGQKTPLMKNSSPQR